MSSLARLSLANRGLTALIAVIIAAFGLYAIPSLKQQLFPALDFPAAFITAPYPGASPEVVESQVTVPIENSIQGIAGLEEVTSTSREGVATLQVAFTFGTDLDDTVGKIETALNRISAQLPQGVDPTVFAGSTADIPVVILSASGTGDESAFAARLEQVVVPELQGIEGVREATVSGAREKLLTVTPDPVKLTAAGLDAGAIATTLRSNGVAIPAGTLTDANGTLTVQVGTPLATIDDIRGLYLTPAAGTGAGAGPSGGSAPGPSGGSAPGPSGGSTPVGPAGAPATAPRQPVKLGDVATVESQLAEVTSISRTNGRPSLAVSVTPGPDGNAVQISHDIADRLAALTAQVGPGTELRPIFDQAPFVEKSIEGLTTEGLLGLVMAILVILFFLLSIRSTVVTAVSIPLSVIIALIALWAGDYSLNVLTLGALTIAIGRVVDDSIVVLENIKRHLEYGEEKRDAILTAVREVAGAVTASTLTTVAVFSPIALVGGIVGQLFAPFAITVTVALLASLLVSLTIIPVLAYWFLKQPGGGADEATIREAAEAKERRSLLQRAYLPVLRFAVTRRLTTVLIGLAVFVATMALGGLLKTNFFDESGQNTLNITQTLPVGTNLSTTDAAAKQVETVLAGTAGVETYQVSIGGNTFGPGGSTNVATFSLTLGGDTDAVAVSDDLRPRLDGLSDVGEITVGGNGGGGFAADQLQVVVQANDDATLRTAAEQVRQAVAGLPDVTDVTSDLATSTPRIQVKVDRAAAARAGLSEATIGQALSAGFRGTPLGQVTLDGEQQDILLRLGATPKTVDEVRAYRLPSATGPIPLDQVADVSEVEGPVQVSRIDGARSATVGATATGENVGATTQELTRRLDALDLPDGAEYKLGGVSADQSEAFGGLGMALLAAIAIVFMIMAAAFRSLIQPLILLVSIPFAATGAIGLLLLTDTALGVPALIGMLMLVGIVVTNAIVLMDLINQYRQQGMGVREAVLEGGRRRLRPILMTAVATIFALLPMALGLTGSGGFISQPLAIVVIGGLLTSTVLTLVLVPTLYTMVENRRERSRLKRERRRLSTSETVAAPEPGPAA